jgi:hypothetical protein
MINLLRILKLWQGSGKDFSRKNEEEIQKYQEIFKDTSFSFREGFADRVIARISNLSQQDPLEVYYKNLSGLFPRIAGISLAAIVVMGIIIFLLNGSLSPDHLLGTEKIDESNFISYLFLD